MQQPDMDKGGTPQRHDCVPANHSDLTGGLLSNGTDIEPITPLHRLDEASATPGGLNLLLKGSKPDSSSRATSSRVASQSRSFHERARDASSTSAFDKEQGVSPLVNVHRSPYPSASPHFLTVVPPLNFPQPSGSDPTYLDRLRRGSLLPLYPTLGGQLWAISREYGLPSIGGLLVYLAEDVEGNLGPQVGDAAWSALWSRYFADDDSAFFSSIGTPNFRSQKPADLGLALSDGAPGSNESDLSRSSDAELSKARIAPVGRSQRPSPKLNGKGSSRKEPGTEWSPSSRSIAWSGRGSSLANRTGASRSSERLAARLPIVGKIEWMVDESRAPWWNAWVSRKSASQPEAATGYAPRRSMHLQSIGKAAGSNRVVSRNASRSGSPDIRSSRRQSTLSEVFTQPLASGEAETRSVTYDVESVAPAETAAVPSSQEKEATSAAVASNERSEHPDPEASGDNQPVPGDAGLSMPFAAEEQVTSSPSREATSQTDRTESPADNLRDLAPVPYRKSMRSQLSLGHDTYAGYSALLDDAGTHHDDSSELAPNSLGARQPEDLQSLANRHSRLSSSQHSKALDEGQPYGNDTPDLVLDGDDEDMWRGLHRTEPEADPLDPRSEKLSVEAGLTGSPVRHTAKLQEQDRELLLATPGGVHKLSHSAIDRHISMSPRHGTQDQDVHEWIRKTSGSPRPLSNLEIEAEDVVRAEADGRGRARPDFDVVEDEKDLSRDEQDDLYPSDVREVVSLWANQVARSSEHLPLIEPPSESRPVSQHGIDLAVTPKFDVVAPAGGIARGLEVADPNPFNASSKQSLRSPIALDNAAFTGPRPDLGDLASHVSMAEQSPMMHVEAASSADQDRDALPRPYAGDQSPRTPMMEGPEPRQERPPPLNLHLAQASGQGVSRRSSAELSDSLEDMQKALELLSPGHSPNPAFGPQLNGARIPSRDSFAFAKTLSASVTPSPRWFSRAKARQSRPEPQSTHESSDSAFFRGHVSPRPASASAAMIGPRRNDFRVPISASRLAQFNDSIKSEQTPSSPSSSSQPNMRYREDRIDTQDMGRGEEEQQHGFSALPDEDSFERSSSADNMQQAAEASVSGSVHEPELEENIPHRSDDEHEDEHVQGYTSASQQTDELGPEAASKPLLSFVSEEPDRVNGAKDVVNAKMTPEEAYLEAASEAHSEARYLNEDHQTAELNPSGATSLRQLQDAERSPSVRPSSKTSDFDDYQADDTVVIHDHHAAHGEYQTAPLSGPTQGQPSSVASMRIAVQGEDQARFEASDKRLSAVSEAAIHPRKPAIAKERNLFGPTSLSMYTLRDSDIEALAGDPEQGMASIERFLRGNSFADSPLPSEATSPGLGDSGASNPLDSHATADIAAAPSLGSPSMDEAPEISDDRQVLDDAVSSSDVGTAKVRLNGAGSERWSQGSHSQSNWTGPDRQSARSSSNGHAGEPETPVFGYDQQLSAQQPETSSQLGFKASEPSVDETGLVSSPETDEHLFTGGVAPTSRARQSSSGDRPYTLVTRSANVLFASRSSESLHPFEDVHPLGAEMARRPSGASSGSTTFGMVDVGDAPDRALNDDEIRQMTESTRAAVREALSSSSSSPNPIYIPQSPLARSSGQLPSSPSPSSPTSIGSFTGIGRRRTSGSSLSGRRKPAAMSLDIDTSGKAYGEPLRPGSASPNSRFRTLPPSPRLIPNQFGPGSSPLSATFPPNSSSLLSSPTSKLSQGSRLEPLSSGPSATNEDLC